MANIFSLHDDLKSTSYKHGGYHAFNISDPKPRNIHKATVRDRLLHHAIYRILYPFFDRTFIVDSYSCRVGKGTHRAMKRFHYFAGKVSKNNTRTSFVLKCDIRKFFASIDHAVLKEILKQYITDAKILWLLDEVIGSFCTPSQPPPLPPKADPPLEEKRWRGKDSPTQKGLPLGNLTSQLLVNIYMNEFDQYAKRRLVAKHYVRYADDFVLLSHNQSWLELQMELIRDFLQERLKIELHPDKLFLKTLASGVDFLGWMHFSDHRVLRTATRRRMFRRIDEHPTKETIGSYLGMLKHGNAKKLQEKIENLPVYHSLGLGRSRSQ